MVCLNPRVYEKMRYLEIIHSTRVREKAYIKNHPDRARKDAGRSVDGWRDVRRAATTTTRERDSFVEHRG